MKRAWLIGFIILFVVDVSGTIAISFVADPDVLGSAVQYLQLAAPFVTAFIAPRKKIILGTSLAIPATAMFVATLVAYQWVRFHRDLGAFELAMTGWALLGEIIWYGLASIAGYFLSAKIFKYPGAEKT